MTYANAESIIVQETRGILGFVFSPDFDTSQQMQISEFMKRFYNKENKVVKTHITYNGLTIPVLLMGSKAEEYASEKDEYINEKTVNVRFTFAKNDIHNVKDMKSKRFGKYFTKTTLNEKEYYLCFEQNFIVYVIDEDCIAFILNPYVYICIEDELMQNPKYKEGYMYLKSNRTATKTYLNEIDNRIEDYIKEFDRIFSVFESQAKSNGFVIGSGRMFLASGYLIATGTKADSDVALKRRLFPYYVNDDSELERYTKEKLDQIEAEKIEYEKKCEMVAGRLEVLEDLLKEKKLHYTVISKNNIQFKDEDKVYYTWMNAQVYDEAHYGWYKEQDFIDWINMEGKIPYKRAQIKHFSKMLEEVSDGKYSYVKCEPVDTKAKVSIYDDYETIGVFKVKGIKENQKLDLDTIKSRIEEIKPIEKYTLEEFEKNFKKEARPSILARIFKNKKVLNKA